MLKRIFLYSYARGRISVKGEYIRAEDSQNRSYGWYIQTGYYLLSEKLQAVARLDSYDDNSHGYGNRIQAFTYGVNWFFSKITKLQINYEYYHGAPSFPGVILARFQAGF
ncbi:MAG: porin [Candidatus Aminicenantes bacterium]